MSLPQGWLQPDWSVPHVCALMTARAGGVSSGPFASMNLGDAVHDEPAAVHENRARLGQWLGAQPVFLSQVHGARVVHLQARDAEAGRPPIKADASISTQPGLACVAQVADCLPVLFAAPKAVGAAHAGWRGLAAGVLDNTVSALCEASGCAPYDLTAWLGPCIGPAAFEVGADVLLAFGVDPESPDSALFTYRTNAAGEPRWLANLAGLARRRLMAQGLSRISGGSWCTVSEAGRFFSFRRDRVCGRMAAAIALR